MEIIHPAILLALEVHTTRRTAASIAMRRVRVMVAFVLALLVAVARAQEPQKPRPASFALAGERNDTLLPLPRTVPALKFGEIEMALMSASRAHILGIFPSASSSYCEQSRVKADWRRFARAIDFVARVGATEDRESKVPKIAEVTHDDADVARIAEVKSSKMSRSKARRLGCGFIALARHNDMDIFDGDSSNGDALASWLDKRLSEVDLLEQLRTRHEVTEFVERNETVVRAILLEETPWMKTLSMSFSGHVAYARASSLVGSKYLRSLPFDRTGVAGLMFVPDMENIEDEDRMKRAQVRVIKRSNETVSFYEFAEAISDAEREIGYAAMMEAAIDVECANAVWELASNSIHPEYTRAETGEGKGDFVYEPMPPPKAWDFIKSDLLDLLDGHGKADRTLTPKQWMCGLAGLTAAHRDVANEYADAAAELAELDTLRKENLALRQRNAVLEREIAQCDSSTVKAPRGSARLPKAKPPGWSFDAAPKKAKSPKPTPPPEQLDEAIEEESFDMGSEPNLRDEL